MTGSKEPSQEYLSPCFGRISASCIVPAKKGGSFHPAQRYPQDYFLPTRNNPPSMRTNRHQYFLDLALRCAHQGTCLRRNFGAIIVDEYNTIVSTGYTGAPRKQVDCTELKRCWRNDHAIPSGSNYEKCRSVHAEMNALLQAGEAGAGVHPLPCRIRGGNRSSHADLAMLPLLEDDRELRDPECDHEDRRDDVQRATRSCSTRSGAGKRWGIEPPYVIPDVSLDSTGSAS